MANKKLAELLQMECVEVGACTREFSFTLSAEAAKAESERTLALFAGMVQLPGFRAGKAPLALVKSKYASQVDEELRNRATAWSPPRSKRSKLRRRICSR